VLCANISLAAFSRFQLCIVIDSSIIHLYEWLMNKLVIHVSIKDLSFAQKGEREREREREREIEREMQLLFILTRKCLR